MDNANVVHDNVAVEGVLQETVESLRNVCEESIKKLSSASAYQVDSHGSVGKRIFELNEVCDNLLKKLCVERMNDSEDVAEAQTVTNLADMLCRYEETIGKCIFSSLSLNDAKALRLTCTKVAAIGLKHLLEKASRLRICHPYSVSTDEFNGILQTGFCKSLETFTAKASQIPSTLQFNLKEYVDRPETFENQDYMQNVIHNMLYKFKNCIKELVLQLPAPRHINLFIDDVNAFPNVTSLHIDFLPVYTPLSYKVDPMAYENCVRLFPSLEEVIMPFRAFRCDEIVDKLMRIKLTEVKSIRSQVQADEITLELRKFIIEQFGFYPHVSGNNEIQPLNLQSALEDHSLRDLFGGDDEYNSLKVLYSP